MDVRSMRDRQCFRSSLFNIAIVETKGAQFLCPIVYIANFYQNRPTSEEELMKIILVFIH